MSNENEQVGAVHNYLIRKHKRMKASILVETGEAREVTKFSTSCLIYLIRKFHVQDHHLACLISYGASLVHPYLAFETVAELAAQR